LGILKAVRFDALCYAVFPLNPLCRFAGKSACLAMALLVSTKSKSVATVGNVLDKRATSRPAQLPTVQALPALWITTLAQPRTTRYAGATGPHSLKEPEQG